MIRPTSPRPLIVSLVRHLRTDGWLIAFEGWRNRFAYCPPMERAPEIGDTVEFQHGPDWARLTEERVTAVRFNGGPWIAYPGLGWEEAE